MAYRIFTDKQGTSWLLLAVYPHTSERRSERDRRTHELPVLLDRRHLPERRMKVRREMETGWLVFKTGGGRRRLSPIVPGWDSFTDEQLEALCIQAVPARRRGDPEPAPAPGKS